MIEIIFMLIFLSIPLGFVFILLNICVFDDLWERGGDDYFFPTVLYKTTNLNMFGCIICSIFLILLNYLYCIPRIIYWLFTVGRRKQ